MREANLAEPPPGPETGDKVKRAKGDLYFQVIVVSVFVLYLEMLLIRWVSTEIRIFAYFKNLTLIACFLGAGLGCLRRRARGIAFGLTGLFTLISLLSWPPSA